MKRKVINDNGRPKAFLGAAIGAVGNLVGGAISKRKQKKAQEKAYRQAQEEQTRSEGVQQAAAMSAQYANQDYVDEYRNKITLKNGGKVNMKNKNNDRVAVAKKFKCGGRKKASLGKQIVSDINTIGDDFRGNNLGNTIISGINAVAGAINGGSGTIKPNYTGNLQSTATTTGYINSAKEIARNAEVRKQQRTTAAKYGTRKKYACGGRKKALFGIGDAIGGVSNIIGAATQSTDPQKQVKKSDGFAYDTPKTGIEQNSYQTDKNGNPITAVNVNNAAGQYTDKVQQAKFGTRRKTKSSK